MVDAFAGRSPSEPAPRGDGVTESSVALSVQGLSKVFPGTKALNDVSLEVRHGEVHALCGGNGCGKSTLIKILSGVLVADQGRLVINGRQFDASELTARTSYELGFRVVHQDPPLYLDLT